MGKKQIRISLSADVHRKISEFMGKDINLVMTDGTVFFGKLKRIENGMATLMNMRLNRVKLSIQKISELYTDVNA